MNWAAGLTHLCLCKCATYIPCRSWRWWHTTMYYQHPQWCKSRTASLCRWRGSGNLEQLKQKNKMWDEVAAELSNPMSHHQTLLRYQVLSVRLCSLRVLKHAREMSGPSQGALKFRLLLRWEQKCQEKYDLIGLDFLWLKLLGTKRRLISHISKYFVNAYNYLFI